ncbi:PPOX class F420-dependent oxidoreductase [Ktedonosporobacter rubrisoli]|uniref:PPOX class F420-dependent oxidoreductase n=1 Tax=Ktedonosporobacter rubrisoli TaxID=2509675 RepID=A0A4P6K1J2_KTERU|nr:PPOX class F420-dependent oxidoreductase [Ktedonosporobacter rubrisoli]QBD81346.1 PPOX class F420-dependent oxidoreductase [Ktedonosporobacter rubrisoli]
MITIPESHRDLLQSTAVAYMSTIGSRGEPQVSPVLFGWDGTQLFFTMNKIRQKYRNLLREPRIALAIADPTNPYRSLEIRGKAVRIEDDPNYHIANVLSQKYTGKDATPNMLPGEQRVAIFVEPERVFVFPFQEDKK